MSKTTRFYPALDIALLKEVTAVNPYDGSDKNARWESILTNVNAGLLMINKEVTLRSCKERVKTLIKAHRRAEMQSLKASGTDEEYSEREQLLTEVDELIVEATRVTEGENIKKTDERKKEEQGREIREAAMQGMTPPKRPGDTETTNTKRPKTAGGRATMSEYLNILKEKKQKEADLKFEQLRLERERFEFEKKEREQRMQRDAATLELITKLVAK